MSLLEPSLNDEALNDLSSVSTDGSDGGLVVEVEPHQTEVNHADAISKELEGYDATLTAVENGIEDHFKLHDVIDTVLAAESISQVDAERIAAVAPEFIEQVGAVQEFTQRPSRTHLTQTQQWVNNRLLASDEAAKAALKKFVTTDLLRIKEIFSTAGQELILNVIDKYRQLRMVAQSDLQYAANSKAFYHCSNDEKDVRDFKFCEFYAHDGESENWTQARAAFLPLELTRNFADVARHPALERLMVTNRGGFGSPAERFFRTVGRAEGQTMFNYISLLGFLATQNFDEILEDLERALHAAYESISQGDVNVEPESGTVLAPELAAVRAVRDYVDYAVAVYAAVRAADDFATVSAIIVAKLGAQLERK